MKNLKNKKKQAFVDKDLQFRLPTEEEPEKIPLQSIYRRLCIHYLPELAEPPMSYQRKLIKKTMSEANKALAAWRRMQEKLKKVLEKEVITQ